MRRDTLESSESSCAGLTRIHRDTLDGLPVEAGNDEKQQGET